MFLLAGTGEVSLNMHHVAVINWVTLGAALVMLVTEWFSGIRAVPIIALAGIAVATFFVWGAEDVSVFALAGWVTAWLAVIWWFLYLVGKGRHSR